VTDGVHYQSQHVILQHMYKEKGIKDKEGKRYKYESLCKKQGDLTLKFRQVLQKYTKLKVNKEYKNIITHKIFPNEMLTADKHE
jgi:predicted transcriptional regulator